MDTQSYSIDSNILFLDNHSTILLSKNCRSSAGKNSKYIKKLITDEIHQEDLEICYNPIGEMLDDYQSKTQQVKLFCNIRAQLMKYPINYYDEE